jgi:hypothetical protein
MFLCVVDGVPIPIYFSIRVRSIRIRFLIMIMIAIENKKSRFDENFSIKVRQKIFNQGLMIKS